MITMSTDTAERPLRAPATVADLMRSATTTVTEGDHAAAASYLMHHASTTSLVVLDYQADKPVGVITVADIGRAVAVGQDLNEIHIHDLLTTRTAAIPAATPVHDAAEAMLSGGYQQLPVTSDAGPVGIIDLTDLTDALPSPPPRTRQLRPINRCPASPRE
jgi:CBS domain-containing protein